MRLAVEVVPAQRRHARRALSRLYVEAPWAVLENSNAGERARRELF